MKEGLGIEKGMDVVTMNFVVPGVSPILIVDSIYSFTTILWWKPTFIRSFHSSAFSLGSTPPMQNALYIPPLFHVWTQKDID